MYFWTSRTGGPTLLMVVSPRSSLAIMHVGLVGRALGHIGAVGNNKAEALVNYY